MAGRKNVLPNPSAAVNTTGWVGGGTITRLTGLSGTPRATGGSVTFTGGAFTNWIGSPRVAAAAGQTWTAVCWVRASAARNITVGLQVWDASNNGGAEFGTTTVALAANTWTQIRITGTLSGSFSTVNVQCDGPSGWVSGNVMSLSSVRLEQVTDASMVYADGDTAGWVWDGTAGSSSSQESSGTTVALGRTNETDSARAVTAAKDAALGRTSEADTARAITAGKAAGLAAAGELGGARALTHTLSAGLAGAAETDGARALTAAKTAALTATGETGGASPLSSSRTVGLGAAGETSGAGPIIENRGLVATAETDEARPLGAEKTYALGRVGETSTADAIVPSRAYALGAAGTTATARAVADTAKTAALSPVAETSGARFLDFSRLHPIGRTGETSGARGLTHSRAYAFAGAGTVEALRSFSTSKVSLLAPATDLEGSARPLAPGKAYAFGRTGDLEQARKFGAAVQTAVTPLTPLLWAVDRATGKLTALPHHVKLTVSPVRNSPGEITVEYPVYGLRFDELAAIDAEDHDLEVEIWTAGKRDGALRGLLTDVNGDDLAEDAIWTFSGTLLPQLLDEALVSPQDDDEKKELVFAAKNAGQVVATCIDQAQDRAGVLVGVTADFTSSVDSTGFAWPTVIDIRFSPSATLLDVLTELVDQGLIDGFDLTPARVLRLFAPGRLGTDRTVGSSQVVFRGGRNLSQAPRRYSSRKSGTAVLVAGAEGVYQWAVDATAQARRGRRIEIAGSANGLTSEAAVLAYAQTYLDTVSPGTLEVSHGLLFGAGHPRPISHFDVGDWVWSDTRGTMERLRVYQWTLVFDVDGISGELVLNTPLVDRVLAWIRKLKRISTGAAVVGTSEPPPAEDTLAPAAPTGVTADSEYYAGVDGAPLAAVIVGWGAVTENTDGSPITDLAGYRVRHRVVVGPGGLPGPWLVHPDVTGLSADFGDVEGGAELDVAVQAFDRSGNNSDWSDPPVRFTTETDTTPPATPSTPTASAYLGQLKVGWNGLSSVGGPMPIDLVNVQVHVSTSAVFTPDATTLRDQFSTVAGERVITDLTYGVTYYVRLVAVDRSGNVSPPTPSASAVPEQVVSADVFAGAIGSAQLANLAVTTAKIDNLAVNDAQFGSGSFGKLTAGTISVAVLNSGIIRTGTTGQRSEWDAAGLRIYSSTALTVDLNGASNLVSGTIKSALSGKRWEWQPSDTTMRFYHITGDYSQFTAYDSYDGSAVMWRAPLDGSGFSGRISVTTIGVNLSFSQETDLTHLRSEVLLRRQDVMITSPLIQFKANKQYPVNPTFGGSQRIVFMFKDSSGIDIADTTLFFQTAPSDQPWFAAPFTNSGLCFDTTALVCQDGARNAIPIGASAFNVISTRAAKYDEADLPFDALDAVRRAPARSWRYLADAAPRPDRPDVGPEILDPAEPFEWSHEQPPARLHFGPMAEDLEAVSADLVTTMAGQPATDVRDLVGVLWAAVQRLAASVDELRRGPA